MGLTAIQSAIMGGQEGGQGNFFLLDKTSAWQVTDY